MFGHARPATGEIGHGSRFEVREHFEGAGWVGVVKAKEVVDMRGSSFNHLLLKMARLDTSYSFVELRPYRGNQCRIHSFRIHYQAASASASSSSAAAA